MSDGGLRFPLGTEVLCKTGPDKWSSGVVVAQNYREPGWPAGKIAPYQVSLDDGGLVFVPRDVDKLVRALKLPWWGPFFKESEEPSPQELRKACAGQDVDERDHGGENALLAAARKDWRAFVLELIDMKADVNAANQKQQRPLHVAVEREGTALARALLEAKADPNVQDTDPDYNPAASSRTFGDRLEHRTPLHHACGPIGDPEMAALLIEAGAKLDIRDAEWKTALHLAIDEGSDKCIDLLLQAKADVNLGNQLWGMKNTPLMHAVYASKRDLAKKLIAAKADINAQGKQDMGALHLAARRGDAKAIELLVEAKADLAQQSQFGTAAELARKKPGSEALLKLLGAGPSEPAAQKQPTSAAAMDPAQRAALFLG